MIAFAAWLYDAAWSSGGSLRGWTVGFSAASALGAFALLALVSDADSQRATRIADDADAYWQPFNRARLDELRAGGTPAFVDFTAAWCLTCKVDERIVLGDAAVSKALLDAGVTTYHRPDRSATTRHDIDAIRAINRVKPRNRYDNYQQTYEQY
jgi:thiol:disulfide interchange protein DsbD